MHSKILYYYYLAFFPISPFSLTFLLLSRKNDPEEMPLTHTFTLCLRLGCMQLACLESWQIVNIRHFTWFNMASFSLTSWLGFPFSLVVNLFLVSRDIYWSWHPPHSSWPPHIQCCHPNSSLIYNPLF